MHPVRIILAPMEGVGEFTMRQILSGVGGLDRCVTEFVRVTHRLLPERVFYRYCPELLHGGVTLSGVPVYLQLLGGDPLAMAENAARAAELGAPGIDINFGCPAKLVNRNDGGSAILKQPERVYQIVNAVRCAVPRHIPVTAKIRLGFDNQDPLRDVCESVFAANANELTIHARTRADGYKPPAYWDAIRPIQQLSPIPIFANGEVWSVDDYQNCRSQSGCDDVMLGRGLLSCPDLALQIKSMAGGRTLAPRSWHATLPLLVQFFELVGQHYPRKLVAARMKQWLGYLRREYPEAAQAFEQIKRARWPEEIQATLLGIN